MERLERFGADLLKYIFRVNEASILRILEAGHRPLRALQCIGAPEGFIPPDKLDFNTLSIEWYLNHSCEGNVGFNDDGDFVARRHIEKSEELTYDYTLAESNPRFRMECKCGSGGCRRIITGNDWKDPAFRAKNLDYMLPRLRREPDARHRGAHPRRAAGRGV